MRIFLLKVFTVLIISFFLQNNLYSQKIPSLQISIGITSPGGDLGGEFISVNDSGYYNISEDFVKNNYGISTGITVAGSIVFPFDEKNLLNFIFSGEYTNMNSFKRSVFGITKVNGIEVPITYDNAFSGSMFGLGLSTNPAVGKKLSLYVNSIMTMNFLSLSFTQNDVFKTYFSDSFRMGIKSGAGINYKLTNEYSLLLGGSYHFTNLFFKSVHGDFNDRLESNVENLSINDEEGSFYTNLSDPDNGFQLVNGKKKNIDLWSINVGIVIFLGKSKK